MHGDYGYFEEEELGKPYDIKMLLRLYPYTRPYKWLLVCSVALVVLITCIDISIPYLTKIAIDRYIVPHSDLDKVRDDKENIRYLEVKIKDKTTRDIIDKYPALFKINGKSATISFNDLSKLEKKERLILRRSDLRGVALIAAIFLLIIIADFILNFLQVMIMEYAGQMIMHDMRMHLFSHIQSLSVAFFTRNPVARLVTRVANDVQNMNELFTSVITFIFKDLFLLVGITIVLVSLHWHLALVSFTVIPFVLFASLYFSNQARNAFRILRIKLAEINTRFSETISGIRVIQLFNQEARNYQNFTELNHENYLAGVTQIKIFAVFMPVIEFLGTVAMALVIFYGGKGVLSESITLGILVAFLSYMKMFFMPIRDIAEKYNIMQNAMASAERIFLILDNEERIQKSEVRSQELELRSQNSGVRTQESELRSQKQVKSQQLTTNAQEPRAKSQEPTSIKTIELENISFEYIKDEIVLKGISLKICAGETIAVVGPTGSGKTSLINLIIRFYDPTSGRVLINGKDIKGTDISMLRSKMALVTQDPFLFSGTIKDNIFGVQENSLLQKGEIGEKQIEYILSASNCKSLVSRLPKGIDTELSGGGASFSSGERQLISIARAFARDPELIILDEATSYIDSETESEIQQALSNLMQNRTTFIVAHRLSTARNADTIIVLNKGRIIESGSHEALMKKKGFYFRLNQL